MSDELACPECDEPAWRGKFPVEDGVRVTCPGCSTELRVHVEVCDYFEDKGWDGVASLREVHAKGELNAKSLDP